jgi:hypothetical protein
MSMQRRGAFGISILLIGVLSILVFNNTPANGTSESTPVFNGQSVIRSLAVIGPVNRMKRNGIQRIGRQVKTVASELSRELAGSDLKRIVR